MITFQTGIPELDRIRLASTALAGSQGGRVRYGYSRGVYVTVGPRGGLRTNAAGRSTSATYGLSDVGLALAEALAEASVIERKVVSAYAAKLEAHRKETFKRRAAVDVLNGANVFGLKLTKAQKTKLAAYVSPYYRKFYKLPHMD